MVNSRQDVTATPGAPTYIFLYPADVAASGTDEQRYITIVAQYRSLIHMEAGGAGGLEAEGGEALETEGGATIETEGGEQVGMLFTVVRQYRFSVRTIKEAI